MGWWKRLKGWQKAGIIVGSVHFIIYFALYTLMSGSMGILVLYDLQVPWLLIVRFVIGDITWSGSKAEIMVLGIAGTIAYSLIAMAIVALLSVLKHRNER